MAASYRDLDQFRNLRPGNFPGLQKRIPPVPRQSFASRLVSTGLKVLGRMILAFLLVPCGKAQNVDYRGGIVRSLSHLRDSAGAAMVLLGCHLRGKVIELSENYSHMWTEAPSALSLSNHPTLSAAEDSKIQ